VFIWGFMNEYLQTIKNSDIVYDIGCGNGVHMINDNFIGIDNSEELLNICREKGLNVLNADMTLLPFKDNSADKILCISSFHHLCTEQRRLKSLLEMKRVLRKDGEIVISVWSISQPKKTKREFKYGHNIISWNKFGEKYERYYYIFHIGELKILFKICGLKIKKYLWDFGNEIFILVKN
jgi:ubiquinone/menaquinone biosynthesis C-methylase UbiE